MRGAGSGDSDSDSRSSNGSFSFFGMPEGNGMGTPGLKTW